MADSDMQHVDVTVARQPRSAAAPNGTKVLLLEFDLFVSVGGGQTSYRRLIERTPWNTYFYFIEYEPFDAPRPVNATPIPFKHYYQGNPKHISESLIHYYGDYLFCWQMARSVLDTLGTCNFDVVDSPDYRTFATFVRAAFSKHEIGVGVVALALHGTISSAVSNQWPNTRPSTRFRAELRQRERLQFRSVDVRYALSRSYALDWQKTTNLSSRIIDPLHMIGTSAPVMAEGDEPPDIVVVGRRERRKGPDIALDFVWAAGPPVGTLRFVGADAPSPDGHGADGILRSMACLRNVEIAFEPPMSRRDLDALFRARSLVLLPSRYDQFNLVALEALLLGCPVIVSDRAGAATWIRENLPELSELIADIRCSRVASERIQTVLCNYDSMRQRVVDNVGSRIKMPPEDDLSGLYEPFGQADPAAQAVVADMQARFADFNMPIEPSNFEFRTIALKALPEGAKAPLKALRTSARQFRESRPFSREAAKHRLGIIARRTGILHEESIGTFAHFSRLHSTRNALQQMPERTSKEIAAKLETVSTQLAGARVGRLPVFREMARLERKRGEELVAATYCLRVMRWLGRDAYGDLDFVSSTLVKHGLEREAKVARAMYDDPRQAHVRSRTILDEAYQANLNKQVEPPEILDDRRPPGQPVVSVIVSLYGAEAKLPTLLENLRLQTLNSDGGMEVVLVDSASPTAERRVFEEYAARDYFPIVYTRSINRETIQGAWNRGIKLARGRYLSFLGADEGLHPECFAELADQLDARPDVDWAMANSIVTNVDRDGIFADDIMPYDRTGYTWQHVFLDTCYLSWVGGLYRRTIHDRFGYYDESFRGAGDTEFKGRILSRIKTLHVPKMLGVFNNYPEERTTQSPRAELEDLRAWYLHRSPAGIAYSFERHPSQAAEELFRAALCYRKSFCGHLSSDADLALSVATYLEAHAENPQFARSARQAATALVSKIASIERIDFNLSIRHHQFAAFQLLKTLRQRELQDKQLFQLANRPHYRIFNDNRHEQHWWSWSA